MEKQRERCGLAWPLQAFSYYLHPRYPELHIPRFIDLAIKFIIAKGTQYPPPVIGSALTR